MAEEHSGIQKNKKAPLVSVAIGAVLGLIAAKYWPAAPLLPFLFFFLLALVLCFLKKSSCKAYSIIALSVLAFYFYGVVSFHIVNKNHFSLVMNYPQGETMVLKVQVTNDPRIKGVATGKGRLECLADVVEIKSTEGWQKAEGKVLLRSYNLKTQESWLKYGDIWQVTGFLGEPKSVSNWGVFDYAKYLQSRGISHILEVKRENSKKLAQGRGLPWLEIGYRLREHMLETLQIGVEKDPEIAALMAGMLFGYTDGIAEETEDNFRITGTLHLFAVSGQNVAVIAGMLLLVLHISQVVTWRWAWTVLPLVFIFCLATGMESSALRAFMMWGSVLIGWRIYRPINLLNILATVALLIWAFAPEQLFDLGFQLSFFVTLALILFCSPTMAKLSFLWELDPWLPRRLVHPFQIVLTRLSLFFCSLFITSLCAILASIPFVLYHFHMLSVVGLIANMVIVPLASLVVLISALSVVASFLWTGFSLILNQVTWFLLKMIVIITNLLADIPGSHTYLRMGFEVKPPSCEARLWVCDGRKSAPIILEIDNEYHLLGPGDQVTWNWIIKPLSQKLGVNQWENLILVQPGKRYCDALEVFVSPQGFRTLIDGGCSNTSSSYKKWVNTAEMMEYPKRFARYGDMISLKETSHVQWLWPDNSSVKRSPDDQGCVLRLVFIDKVIIMASNISVEVENHILERKENLRADVLIQGEHTRLTNLSYEWLEAIQPKHLVRHSLGFSSDRSLSLDFWQTCENKKITVWRLSETGGIQIIVNAEDVHLEKYNID
ncbi:MAG: ComEC/Rec2 family competence protein [Verrucomicrobiota bacterium]